MVGPYQPRLFAYLRYQRRDNADAEDLLQEVLIRAWRGLVSGHAPQRPDTWLFSIARNLLIDRGRHERARPRLVSMDERPAPVDHETPEDAVRARETQIALEAAIAELPEKQREVFLLRLNSDLTFRDIADLRDEPLSTVLGHMSYAVAKLRRRLKA